ncbi:MAG: MFS transporter, partial [Comamonas sp.]
SLVAKDKQASAIALMFSGLTLATLLGVPAGTWIGQHFGWRMAFAAVALVGVAALAILAVFVPANLKQSAPVALRDELSILASAPLWMGLGITVFGFGGVFALYTYVEPLLSQITHMAPAGVAVALLLFGAGSAVGNIAGGKLADRGVLRALWITLSALVAVLLLGRWAFSSSGAVAMAYIALLGLVAFATVAPMQMRVMQGVGGQSATLASSLNISAFNLGNALGAWVSGSLIAGTGLLSIAWGAAALSALGLVLVGMSQRPTAGIACAANPSV